MHPRIEKHIETVKKTIRSFFPIRPGGVLQNFDKSNPEILIKFDDPSGREPGFVERIQLRKIYGQVDVSYADVEPDEDTYPGTWNKMLWVDTTDPTNLVPKIYSSELGKYIPVQDYIRILIDPNSLSFGDNGMLEIKKIDGGIF